MNLDLLKGNWLILLGRVKQACGQFDHDELLKIEGQIQELRGQIQRAFGEFRQQAKRQIEPLAKTI
jgi:uncharacterized protein YjbJ (UPF0337 family)